MSRGSFEKLAFFLFFSFVCFSPFLEEKENEWVLAVAQFEFENADPIYASYSKTVPEMFLTYLNGRAYRIQSLSEKRMRELMKVGSKRLKLIREREKLIEEKDSLSLSIVSEKEKKKKLKNLAKQIKDTESEIEKTAIDIKIVENKFYDEKRAEPLTLWKEGESLYKYDEHRDLGYTLQKDGISAIILGSLRDASGYLVMKVSLDTGFKGVPSYSFTEAGRYSDIEKMVQKIASQIYTVIQNTKEIKVFFDVSPEHAKVYIDGEVVNDFSKPVRMYEGEYKIEAVADDYITSTKTVLLKDKNYYKLKIRLKRENSTLLAFNIEGEPDVFFKTRYYGSTQQQLQMPYRSSVVEFEKNGVRTYVLLDKEKIPVTEAPKSMILHLNQKETKKLVDRQRRVMYWSLGVFYALLPTYLILGSVYNDRKLSLADGRLPQTAENEKKINSLSRATVAMQSLTIVAGINYFAQLIVYLVFSDRAIPKEPKILVMKEAKHDVDELKLEMESTGVSDEAIVGAEKEDRETN